MVKTTSDFHHKFELLFAKVDYEPVPNPGIYDTAHQMGSEESMLKQLNAAYNLCMTIGEKPEPGHCPAYPVVENRAGSQAHHGHRRPAESPAKEQYQDPEGQRRCQAAEGPPSRQREHPRQSQQEAENGVRWATRRPCASCRGPGQRARVPGPPGGDRHPERGPATGRRRHHVQERRAADHGRQRVHRDRPGGMLDEDSERDPGVREGRQGQRPRLTPVFSSFRARERLAEHVDDVQQVGQG